MSSIVLALFIFIFCLSFISAGGCCFDSGNGICTPNALESGCDANLGGQFFSSPRCEISECNSGCCVIGNSVSMTTSTECQAKTLIAGFASIDFRDISVKQCFLLMNQEQVGACVLGIGTSADCDITTANQCAGSFNPGSSCTDVQTRCTSTDKTICSNGDVYSVDSCGNRDNLVSDCDYSAGTMCKQVDVRTAECKSLDCSDPKDVPFMEGATTRRNGERWCIGPLTDIYRDYDVNNPLGRNLGNAVKYTRESSGAVSVDWPSVYTKNISNPETVYYIVNRWTSTYIPGLSVTGDVKVGIREAGSSVSPKYYIKVLQGVHSGSFEAYEVFTTDIGTLPNIADKWFFQGWKTNIPPSARITVGDDFFSAYCLDGEVHIDACNPTGGRNAYCWGGSVEEDSTSLGSSVGSSPATGNAVKITGKVSAEDASCSQESYPANPDDPDPDRTICIRYTCRANANIYFADCNTAATAPITTIDAKQECINACQQYVNYANSPPPASSSTSGSSTSSSSSVCSRTFGNSSYFVCPVSPQNNDFTVDQYDDSTVCNRACASGSCVSASNWVIGFHCPIPSPNIGVADSFDTFAECNTVCATRVSSYLNLTYPLSIIPTASPPKKTGGKCIINPGRGDTCFNIDNQDDCNINLGCYWLEGRVTRSYFNIDCDQHPCGLNRCSVPLNNKHNPVVNFINISEMTISSGVLFPGLAQCMPKIPSGGEFLTNGPGGVASSVPDSSCSSGSFSATEIIHTTRDVESRVGLCFAGTEGENHCANSVTEQQKQKCMIVTYPNVSRPIGLSPWNSNLWRLLEEKSNALGDCAGDKNLFGQDGSRRAPSLPATLTGGDAKGDWSTVASASRESKIWRAPVTGSCSDCKYPVCSPYMCKSLGMNCDFKEKDVGNGKVQGFCVSSNDLSPPRITGYTLNPKSPLLPYSSVEINITTNEVSMCTFRLGIGGSPNASVRENPFGEGFATEHRIVLSVPGRFPAELPETVPEFDLLSNDGQYQMLVKCEDISGNPTLTSYPINFEVMQTPDTLEPILTNFRPISGSYVLSGATSQAISFRLNEPAECKWDSVDTNFLSMANSFYCDTSPSNIGFLQGYHCSGTLTNITSILNQESAYYIRCKDQPWLEWNEDGIYSRNENRESKVYVLKPSAPLIVSNVLPNGSIVSGSNIPNITLSASTSNGAEFGKASCRWRYTLRGVTTSYYPFTITNSSSHSVLLNSGLVNGSYLFQVMCQDVAGNIGYGNSTIELRVDRSAPIITRVFNDKGNLKIGTSEPSVCKYMFGGASISCLFSLNSPNLTAMYGTSSTEHTTPWRKGSTYLLKCQDLFGNENTNCGMVVNAY